MKKIFFLTAFVVFIFIPISVSADVIINEIAWMGGEVEGIESKNWWRYEWLELYNADGAISLDGWKIELYRDNLDFTIDLTGAIGDYFLVAASDKIPNYDLNYSNLGGKFNNNGQKVILKNEQGNIIDEVDATDGWPAGNNTTKQTMERTTDGWQTSLNPGGTPKTQNSSGAVEEFQEETPEQPSPPPTMGENQPPIADAGNNIIGFINQEIEFDGTDSSDPDEDELFYSWNMGDGKVIDKPSFTYKYSYPGTYLVTLTVSDGQDYALDTITIKVKPQQITINEFIPNPEGKDEENEWIEIYNDSDSIVDISDWQLDDIASGSKPFIFPENTLIAPKSYIVFSRQITGIALNNDKDSVRLLLPEGVVFQEINYEDPKQGQSSAHTDEGFVWNVPTPGMANIVSPPTNIGLGREEEFVYQRPIEPETTKEPSQDYSWYYQSDFDKEIEGGYTFLPIKEQPKADDQFAAISNLAPQAKFNENQKAKQDILNLVLMIIAVILAGLIIGLFLTKLSKKFP